MHALKLHRVVAAITLQPGDTIALQRAENEGWPTAPRGVLPARTPPRAMHRLRERLSRRLHAWMGDRVLSLRELRGELRASRDAAVLDVPLRDLLALIDRDLAACGEDDLPRLRRPLSAWRARYNRLDEYLRP